MVNVLDKLPKKVQGEAKTHLQKIAYAEGVAQADGDGRSSSGGAKRGVIKLPPRLLSGTGSGWSASTSSPRACPELAEGITGSPDASGRTTNVVESPFAALRLRTDAAKRYKKVENATAVIFKMRMLAERRFRRLNAPDQMKQVFLGVQFKDGIEVKQEGEQRVAA